MIRDPLPPPSVTAMQSVVEPSAFRAKIAGLISLLRSTRPRRPFWMLHSHRAPTLRLYRDLLRYSPNPDIRFRIRMIFQKNKSLTSPAATKLELQKGYRWLDVFRRAHQGDIKLQRILERYGSMIAAKRENEKWKQLIKNQLMEENVMRHRPILTGTFHRASYYNKPLPRMKVQPLHVSGMIHKRMRARQRRRERQWTLTSWTKDIEAEDVFERTLERNAAKFGQTFEGAFQHVDWLKNIFAERERLHETFQRDNARLHAPYTDELIQIVEAARREKHRNLTNEKIRERRGEMTRKWLKRRRSRPPSLMRYRMTEKEKMTWWVSKCVSEVGYIGMLKRKLGIKLKNPDAWKREHGLPHLKEKVDRDLAVVKMGNRRRVKLGSETSEA
ncbi:hypothetical protein BJ322DRAFT_141431 [Thelephora terrestris]|uniref:Complex 1 LYR protein domain-containing protein n=1 Tax=Thelephora terrestris TaxID=56493 RepID=A0A9P6HDW1_9AGAM|nr:hypothetical protein BJ322DRAFT_141431 [Thelephora terrestris]